MTRVVKAVKTAMVRGGVIHGGGDTRLRRQPHSLEAEAPKTLEDGTEKNSRPEHVRILDVLFGRRGGCYSFLIWSGTANIGQQLRDCNPSNRP
jgi:hypothetical protein